MDPDVTDVALWLLSIALSLALIGLVSYGFAMIRLARRCTVLEAATDALARTVYPPALAPAPGPDPSVRLSGWRPVGRFVRGVPPSGGSAVHYPPRSAWSGPGAKP